MLFSIKTNFAGQVTLDLESPTLKSVLIELSKKARTAILHGNDNDDVQSEFKVYVDGSEYETLPDKLNTKLTNQNILEVVLVFLSGG